MVFPPTHPFSGIEGAVEDLGDLEFLRDKELLGDLLNVRNVRSTVGTGAFVTPASGKTFFHIKSKIVIGVMLPNNVLANLENDGTIIDTLAYITSTAASAKSEGKSEVGIADSLVGNGIKVYRIEITFVDLANNIDSVMEGWIQDT